ncbi:MAG: FMN-binding protein [Candidatus Izemoplasmatales bacterium]|nr:FMN-binding protein [Candidatus Izemoplasmatales bacterium]MDD4988344.1 FMN-binding protein [Candidatus Izemoplasmatales bacterium]
MIGWIIAGVVLVVLVIFGYMGWSKVSREHAEARSLPLNSVDFNNLDDGTYTGHYEGGMYKWRANTVQVTIRDGKVVEIVLVDTIDPAKDNFNAQELYHRVIDSQSLQVDCISGATLTSKAYLQAIENALIEANN